MKEEHLELQSLLEKIYHERGFDFREYKDTTLKRRIGRRLRACGVDTYAGYEHVSKPRIDIGCGVTVGTVPSPEGKGEV
jgi:hypothetical protein